MLRDGNTAPASARYRVLGPLGSGGFGAVYEAVDTRIGQRIALKELDDQSGDSISRFKQEFRALIDCHHPNLVSLKELIEHNGRWLIAMELVPGTDFRSYVGELDAKEVWRFDEARLRGSLAGIVAGLRALHGYGILHRDLKPSNVRVTPEGRAVLLDFGLVTSIRPEHQSTHAIGLGTAAYMAPEQAMAKQLGPQADVYALGVCLFEALTGALPFQGASPVEIILRKQREAAPAPSSLAAGVPPDLDALCRRMLEADPAQRPDLREVQTLLSGQAADPAEGASPNAQAAAQVPSEEAFSGRETELANLAHALAQTHDGALRVVLIEGESGIGKSELSAEFLRRAQLAHPKLLALRGRCYENEQVSYKAFDGCIDELSKVLGKLSRPECTALLPPRASLLGQLFPVLRKVFAIAQASREGTSADPTARRLEAFGALAALLSKIAEERPLVLVVDDLQWADSESFRLLQALLESPHRPPLLLLGTIRPRAELEPEVLAHVTQLRQWSETSVIEVLGLPLAQAKALAQKLLGRPVPDVWLTVIARESEGNPLFLGELVQYSESQDIGASGTLRLEDALRARISRLDRAACELLELAALAGRPYGSHVLARALGVPNVDDAARTLLAAKLLRLRKGQELGCFHDRIRQSAVGLIPRARLAGMHRRLAEALASTDDADPSELARHWDLAGEHERASLAYERAGTQVLETLAFTRAEALFARAHALLDDPHDPRAQHLTVQQAHALAAAGRSGEAAVLFQRAADRAHGDERIQLRSFAAKHLVLSAKVTEGLSAVRQLLAELGFRVPDGRVRMLVRYLWESLRTALSRGKPWPGRTGTADPALHQAYMLFPVTTNLDPLAYLFLLKQFVRRASKDGSDVDAARAAAARGWFQVLQGSLDAGLTLLESARKVIEAKGDAAARAALALTAGSAHVAASQYNEAVTRLLTAQKLLREECPDLSWMLLNVRYHLSSAWYHTGEHARLASEVEAWLAEARERNDMLSVGLIAGLGYGSVRHLMADAPAQAIAEIEQGLTSIPAEPFSFPHLGALLGNIFTKLYQGGRAALDYFEAHERAHGKAFLMRTPVVRDARLIFLSQALLAAARTAPEGERAKLLAAVRKPASKLVRSRLSLSQALGELAFAQVDAATGQRERALLRTRRARAQLDVTQHNYRHLAHYLESALEGSEQGRAQCQALLEGLEAQGWRKPRRAIELVLPLSTSFEEGQKERLPRATTLLRGRYEVLRALGAGGFGSVFSVRDVQTGRQLALKELTREGGLPLQRFKQEFRALQEVQHQNIVQIESLFESAGCWYIAMELVEGDDLIGYVRASGRHYLARLHGAFAGVVEGLSALHEAGFVHRDVRPENVKVTPDGRAVLLDFGLVARIGDEAAAVAVGAPEDAPPEQLEGAIPRPSADVYALGSCLYRALTGKAPYTANFPLEFAQKKRERSPRAPDCPDAPALVDCCLRMLAADPNLRPSLRELRETLRAGLPEAQKSVEAGPESPQLETFFSGRKAELDALEAAFERVRTTGLRVVLIEGESGVGKSALVAEFARRRGARSAPVWVIQSRCYENEQIAHKAFDGAIDQLAQRLRALPPLACEQLLPKRAALLAQLFPVLGSVPAIGQASKKGLPADPSLRQLAARECFIELFERLCAEVTPLLVVDDLQWADSESFRLLESLLVHASSLPLLLIATVRPESELDDERSARALATLRARAESERLVLTGLSERDADALVESFARTPLAPQIRARIVAQSKGHPLFVRELVAEEQSGADRPRPASLDEALRARIAQCEPDARTLLSMVALAGKPYGRHVYARALGAPALAQQTVLGLLSSGFLRRRGDDELSCYHDRIQRAALDLLAPSQRTLHARALAEALEFEPRTEAAERARLWDEAGEVERAIGAYEQAGDRALLGLAFARAEQQYARALALHGEARDERWRRLTVQRAHALARAGRSRDAAAAYGLAAEGAPRALEVHLRMVVAQQLLHSAQVEEGLAAATRLLTELGESVPRSEHSALARIAWEDIRVRLRGLKERRRSRPISSEARIALDALSGLAPIVTLFAPYAGMALTLRFLRHALDAGVPELTARALAVGAMWRTIRDPHHDHTPEFEHSRKLADEVGDPLLIALVEMSWGVACMQNQVRAAPTHFSIAHEVVQARCPGLPWMLTTARMNLGAVWSYSGDTASIIRYMGGWMSEARACQDKLALAALPTFGSATMRHILRGHYADALAELDEGMAPVLSTNFTYMHFGALFQRAAVRTASGDIELIEWLDREDPALRRQLLMRVPTCRLSLDKMRVSGHLLTLDAPKAARSATILARVKRETAAIARNTSQPARGTALLCEAVVRALESDAEGALDRARRAGESLGTVGNYLQPGAHYLEGWLEGGASGSAKCAAVLRGFADQGWADPRRGLAICLPGAHLFA